MSRTMVGQCGGIRAALRFAAALLVGTALAGCGCRDGKAPPESVRTGEGEAPAQLSTPEERMRDKEYVAKLHAQRDKERDILVRIDAARAAYARGVEANLPEAELAALSNAVVKCYRDLERNTDMSRRIVSQQMMISYGKDDKPVTNNLNEQQKGN